MGPGATVLERMFFGPHSSASVLVNDWIPAFAAAAGAHPGHPPHAYAVMMLTILPIWGDTVRYGKAARQQLKVPFRSMSTTVRHPLGESSSVGHAKLPAALLIRMSIPP